MATILHKVLTLTAACADSTTWIPLNIDQMQYVVGYTIQKTGVGVAPVVHLEGTLVNTIATSLVSAAEIFALASAPATSSVGVNIIGKIAFPIAALRITTISGGSGASTLRLSVIESGLV